MTTSADEARTPHRPDGDLAALPPGLADALATLTALNRTLAAVDARDLDGAQAATVARVLAASVSVQSVVKAQLLPVIEADGLWATGGSRSFTRWVATHHRVGVHTAAAQVRLGRALRDDLPETARAALAGDVTLEQAQVLATVAPTTDRRRAALADPENPCNETFLVWQAGQVSVDGLRLLTRRWAAYADPDADDRGYVEAADREYLELSRTMDGYHLAGFLTVEHGQALTTALRAVTPVPASGDERTAGQRRAQGLYDLARLALDHGLAGAGRAVRPHLNVIVDYQTLRSLAAGAVTTDSLSTSRATGDGSSVGPQLEDGTPIPRVLLERIACDSDLTRIVFGPHSQVLDVGRAERTFTGPRRTALVARDRHCRYPGCTAPPGLSEGHHVQHWTRDHGDTSVANGILLCWYHHDLVHRRGIEIHRENARWVFTDRYGGIISDETAPPDSTAEDGDGRLRDTG